jgi:hypothetical protein
MVLAPNESPMTADLVFEATEPARLEAPHEKMLDGHQVEDFLRITQMMQASGTVTVGEETFEVDRWFGARDHSWGVRRHLGGFWPRTASSGEDNLSGLFLWACWRTESFQGYVQVQEEVDGTRRYLDGDLRLIATDELRRVTAAEHDITFLGNTNLFTRVEMKITVDNGDTYEVSLRPAHMPFGMTGTGYFDGFDDELGFGVYRGDDYHEYDEYTLHDDGIVEYPGGRCGRPWHREANVLVTCNGEEGTGYIPFVIEGKVPRYNLDLPTRSYKGAGIAWED